LNARGSSLKLPEKFFATLVKHIDGAADTTKIQRMERHQHE